MRRNGLTVVTEADGGVASPVGEERFVREAECKRRTGLDRVTRWRMERRGEFPRRRRISPGIIGWLNSELAEWLRSRDPA
jgi:prophage regulatory protein